MMFIQLQLFLVPSAILAFVPISSNNGFPPFPSAAAKLHRHQFIQFSKPKRLSSNDIDQAILPLMELSSAHFTSQALNAFVQLDIADLLGDDKLTLEELCALIGPNTNADALLRTFRLLVSAGILDHATNDADEKDVFSLSNTGALLQTQVPGQPSLASGISHWMEAPLWDSWLCLPDYIKGTRQDENNVDPFQRANGQSSDYYYNAEHHPQSLQYANDFVRFISDGEVDSIVKSLDWSKYSGKTILDVGGYNGKLLDAIAAAEHMHSSMNIKYQCLDLPQVIANVKQKPQHVELIGGNILDPSSVPPCDVILMKHFLDRCMWTEEETIRILQTCHGRIPQDGHVILGEAVIPDFGQAREGKNRMQVSLDALYMLVGRERQRTESEWRLITELAGFQVEEIIHTSSASCSLIVLTKRAE